MSEEQAQETTQEAAPSKKEVWDALSEGPITSEDVAGTKPADEERAPDRALVAPSIREFIKQNTPKEQSALEKEIADLRGALDAIAAPKVEEVTAEQQMLAKLEALETRETERATREDEARAEEEYQSRVRSMREGVIENIKTRKEDFPGLIALEQEETAFNALVQRLQEGEDTSEDDIASEIETGLKEVYEKLHKVYGISEDTTPASEPKATLTNDLTGNDEPLSLENLSKKDAIAALWAKSTQ